MLANQLKTELRSNQSLDALRLVSMELDMCIAYDPGMDAKLQEIVALQAIKTAYNVAFENQQPNEETDGKQFRDYKSKSGKVKV